MKLVPTAVHALVDLQTPSSGESDRNDLRVFVSMTAHDALEFVIGDRGDYDGSVGLLRQHRCDHRPLSLLVSTVSGPIAGWAVADRLPMRFQLPQHKVVSRPAAREV